MDPKLLEALGPIAPSVVLLFFGGYAFSKVWMFVKTEVDGAKSEALSKLRELEDRVRHLERAVDNSVVHLARAIVSAKEEGAVKTLEHLNHALESLTGSS